MVFPAYFLMEKVISATLVRSRLKKRVVGSGGSCCLSPAVSHSPRPPPSPPPPPPLKPWPPQRRSCDVLLVDGDHGYRGALQDIRNMRALAKPGAVLLVDDLDEGPGPALRQAQAEGLVEILDIRMFNASTVAS